MLVRKHRKVRENLRHLAVDGKVIVNYNKVDCKPTGCGRVYYIELAQYRVHCWCFLNIVLNHNFSKSREFFDPLIKAFKFFEL
jgi:hypothetical protein